MPSAQDFVELATVAMERRKWKKAAFLFHQGAEQLYHCVNLVCTFYTPHNHNLKFLRTQAEGLDERLRHVWPMGTRKERAMFAKLKEAYIKARYSKHYRISVEELTWLGERVEELGRIVHTLCSERIAELKSSL